MQDLTAKPEVDLAVDEETGDFTILTGDDLLSHRYDEWTSHQMDLSHPAAIPPDNEYKVIPRAEQFWDKRCRE